MPVEKASYVQFATPEVRLSYPELFEAKPNDQGRRIYSASFILPKPASVPDGAQRNEIKAFLARAQELIQAVATEYGWKTLEGVKLPIKDGDGIRPNKGLPYGPECHGGYLMAASSGEDFRPVCVLNERDPVNPNKWKGAEPKDLYAGCYVRASISAYAWENKNGRGVSFNVHGVQKLRDGESLGGYRADPETMFGAPSTGVASAGSVSAESIFG